MNKLSFSVIAFALFSPNLYAARPMLTDDARITEGKSCQLETWVKSNKNSTEYWALPACNLTENLELTVGGAISHDANGSKNSDAVYQVKILFKQLQSNSWGYGLVVGNVRHPSVNTQNNLLGDVYAFMPTSTSFSDDNFVLHTNLGLVHSQAENQTHLTWGLGSETKLSADSYLIAEAFGQGNKTPFYQVGIRHWLVPNRVQIDTTYGDRLSSGNDERWFSIGFRLLSPSFLP